MKELTFNARNVSLAAGAILNGDVLAVPTDTLYGFIARADNPRAVGKVFDIKGRAKNKAMIVCSDDIASLENEVKLTPLAKSLLERFSVNASPASPASPLTLILNRRDSSNLPASTNTLAVRLPRHPVMQMVFSDLRKLGLARPLLVAPSANVSFSLSPSRASHVLDSFANDARVSYLLKDDTRLAGIESTVLDLSKEGEALPVVLRAGALPLEQIADFLGLDDLQVLPPSGAKTMSDKAGYLLRLGAEEIRKGERGLAFGGSPAGSDLDLSPSGNLQEAAKNLFDHLHRYKKLSTEVLAVGAIPNEGVGQGINTCLQSYL